MIVLHVKSSSWGVQRNLISDPGPVVGSVLLAQGVAGNACRILVVAIAALWRLFHYRFIG
jgi:hypothetical protein